MVDDDPKLCGLVQDYLEPLGYAVDAVHTGPEGVEAVKLGDYRAVILDVMLPVMDGFEVLREIRRESEVPVLMLTGRGEEADRVMGLELGADDYIVKPFGHLELLARMRSIFRRVEGPSQKSERPFIPACTDPPDRFRLSRHIVHSIGRMRHFSTDPRHGQRPVSKRK